MENVSQFDLNSALQHWLERLGQSPQVKAENLMELESHVRDSVVQLQTKGLSSEESFLIATHRIGSPAKLEPEFEKVNRNPLNKILHGLILIFFSICCYLLWGISQYPTLMGRALQGRPLPAPTEFVVTCGSYLAIPPLLAAGYCMYVWTRKSGGRSSWMGFFATTIAFLFFITLPILLAMLLPMIRFMNELVLK
jgi:hypothetical protein